MNDVFLGLPHHAANFFHFHLTGSHVRFKLVFKWKTSTEQRAPSSGCQFAGWCAPFTPTPNAFSRQKASFCRCFGSFSRETISQLVSSVKRMNEPTFLASFMSSELVCLFNKLELEYCSPPSPFAMAESA